MNSTSHRYSSPTGAEAATMPLMTALVVEDDIMIRKLIMGICARAGMRVLEAECGADALETCRSFPQRIDVMITDLDLPGMRGRVLAGLVATLRPQMKIIFCSGAPEDDLDETGDFLQKPFTSESLLTKIRTVTAS